ncbi:hypothetical protein GCM10011348_35460 [Marinobacterium nitratireducens]|uniref:Uncharacterized protein n=2 Tax=Marinobacterium nitratireducens TaxID=518897 RepID=A0A917ZL78_9GAMM|nr:hypothetical protein GCM10011348_35460 [Marinobacterium nitratireducens]
MLATAGTDFDSSSLTLEDTAMAVFTVILTDGTRGKVEANHVRPGDKVTVSLKDDSGGPLERDGEVMEVLCQSD